jgi:hypothetical protein
MADVFLSYVSEERAQAQLIAAGLEGEGFSVWWDPHLEPGEVYSQVIDREIRAAKVVVVLWSSRSVESYWVCSEATVGFNRGTLVPARIDRCDVPTGFVLVQYVDVINWNGDRDARDWRQFVDAVRKRKDKAASHLKPTGSAADHANMELIYWDTVRQSDNPADFHAYIARYPTGAFVELARNRIATRKEPGLLLRPRKGDNGLLIGTAAAAALLVLGMNYLFLVSARTASEFDGGKGVATRPLEGSQ